MVQARRDGDALDLRLAENWDQHNSLQYSWRQLCQTVQVRSLVLEEAGFGLEISMVHLGGTWAH